MPVFGQELNETIEVRQLETIFQMNIQSGRMLCQRSKKTICKAQMQS